MEVWLVAGDQGFRDCTGTITAREGQELAWVRPARLADYPMPPADAPLIPLLRDLL